MGNMGNRTFVLSGAYYYVWGGGKEKNDPELSKWIPPRPWLVHLPHCDTTLVLGWSTCPTVTPRSSLLESEVAIKSSPRFSTHASWLASMPCAAIRTSSLHATHCHDVSG